MQNMRSPCTSFYAHFYLFIYLFIHTYICTYARCVHVCATRLTYFSMMLVVGEEGQHMSTFPETSRSMSAMYARSEPLQVFFLCTRQCYLRLERFVVKLTARSVLNWTFDGAVRSVECHQKWNVTRHALAGLFMRSTCVIKRIAESYHYLTSLSLWPLILYMSLYLIMFFRDRRCLGIASACRRIYELF